MCVGGPGSELAEWVPHVRALCFDGSDTFEGNKCFFYLRNVFLASVNASLCAKLMIRIRLQTPSWISLKYPNPGQYFSKIYKRAISEPWNGLHKPLTTRAIGTKRMCWLWLLKIGLKSFFNSLAERK